MKKIIFLLLLLSSFISADIIHNVSYLDAKNRCINNNYYTINQRFYYQYSKDTSTFHSSTSKNYSNTIINGYVYDTDSEKCYPDAWRVLGMSIEDFHFLNALIGLFFGLIFMIITIYLFMTVGSKK